MLNPLPRTLVAATVVASLAAAGLATGAAGSSKSQRAEETKTLAQLYADAKAEGGKLVVYAGGDWKNQQDDTKKAFEKRFPGIHVEMVVDYSKYHNARIDNQLATGTLVPDVVQLQTLQDFPRWKAQGTLLRYKPAGFGTVYDKFKDKDGAWIATNVLAFGAAYNKRLVGKDAPGSVKDFADPKWRGRIASAYPNDDDATLYLYSLYVRKYGWNWLAETAKNTEFLRGSDSAGNLMSEGKKAIGLGGWVSPDVANPGSGTVAMLPDTGDPFMAWGQREAIFKDAKHPAAAKLFLNWQLSKKTQAAETWSVRTDIAPAAGLKQVWRYANANLDGFPAFMRNRAAAERLRQQVTVYIGEVQGKPTPGRLGTHPR